MWSSVLVSVMRDRARSRPMLRPNAARSSTGPPPRSQAEPDRADLQVGATVRQEPSPLVVGQVQHARGHGLVDRGLEVVQTEGPERPRVLHDAQDLSLIHISEPTRLGMISYAVFCLKKKKN